MDFKLPDIGEGVHEGEVTKWLVKVGDKVEADQPMVEVMTDKATVEIPSPVSGEVEKLHANEGETIEVGKVLLTIREGGKAATASAAPAKSAPAPRKEVPEAPAAPSLEMHRPERTVAPPPPPPVDDVLPFEILATPATRKLARDLSVDLRSVRGSGPHGRVTKTDVQLAHEGRMAASPRPSHSAVGGTGLVPASARSVPIVVTGQTKRIPLKGIRKRIAEAMTHSKNTAAHFTYAEEVDMTAVVKLRSGAAEEAKKRGVKLTFLPFIIKAVIPALKEFPYLNASLDDAAQEIILKGDYNLGIATDTPGGLVVPVVKNADRKSLWEIAAEIGELSERARTGKSQLDDLRGGTFTLTNAGSIGGVFTTPIINHPEVAILGVNAIRKRPVVVDDQIVVRDMMYLSMSVDHRVVDGADAARFINRVIYFLSDPTRLVFA